MATWAIGDVHGCWHTLQRLLRRIEFAPSRDRLWLTGDLAGRSSGALAAVEWARDAEGSVTVVLGNHDLKLLARAARHGEPCDDALAWLGRQALLHVEGDAVLVHAGLAPDWDLVTARALARAVEEMVREPTGLAELWRERDQRWRPGMRGNKAVAAAAAVLTRIRMVDAEGRPDLEFTGPPEQAAPGCRPWWSEARVWNDVRTVVFGHWAQLGVRREGGAVCVDSGCMWGGSLTALDVVTGTVVQEPLAAEDHGEAKLLRR